MDVSLGIRLDNTTQRIINIRLDDFFNILNDDLASAGIDSYVHIAELYDNLRKEFPEDQVSFESIMNKLVLDELKRFFNSKLDRQISDAIKITSHITELSSSPELNSGQLTKSNDEF
jgi:hypothetical protein